MQFAATEIKKAINLKIFFSLSDNGLFSFSNGEKKNMKTDAEINTTVKTNFSLADCAALLHIFIINKTKKVEIDETI